MQLSDFHLLHSIWGSKTFQSCYLTFKPVVKKVSKTQFPIHIEISVDGFSVSLCFAY